MKYYVVYVGYYEKGMMTAGFDTILYEGDIVDFIILLSDSPQSCVIYSYIELTQDEYGRLDKLARLEKVRFCFC